MVSALLLMVAEQDVYDLDNSKLNCHSEFISESVKVIRGPDPDIYRDMMTDISYIVVID